MTRPRVLSIRWTLWLAIALAVASSMLGTTGLMGYRMYRQLHLTDRIRVQALTEAYATQIAGRLTTDRRTDLAGFLDEIAWHPDSRVLAVFGPDGTLLACRGPAGLLGEYPVVKPADASTWRLAEGKHDALPEYTVASVPLRAAGTGEVLGAVVYATVTPAADAFATTDNWGFFVYLILIAATGMLIGFVWIKRSVLDPLAMLSRTGRTEGKSTRSAPLPLERDDEIGMLARTLSTMQVDLDEWRDRADRLERSIDHRVAHATEHVMLELKKAEKKIWTDPLTRLGNRRLLDDKFGDIFHAQQAAGQELSIVMLDLDHFKRLNDTLGHRTGDSLLEFTGELLRQCIREQDLAVRYGGDEFMLILPSVTAERAKAIAERTIAMFGQRSKLLPIQTRPTLSAGIASLQQHQPDSAEDLLEMADSALYGAKFAGKGRAMVYSPATAGKNSHMLV